MPVVQINNFMVIYKVINKINNKWYIGKDAANRPYYYGSGIAIKNAIKKYGKENFEKIILETCSDKAHLIEREKAWIAESDAVNDPMSYNLAAGGEGGDLSKYIDYSTRKIPHNNFKQAHQWYSSLTDAQKHDLHARQAAKRTKGWYVSRVDDPAETYIQNISKWCEEHNVDKAIPSALNNPKHHLYQKQTKGWRIRRSDMPSLPPYENLRGKVIVNNNCSGKTWQLVNGKRVWVDK
jgi:hypothetical protein